MRSDDGATGVATDATERHMLQKEFERRAFHDPLTGLPNRELFMDRIGHALEKAGRRGEGVAVLYMDLDDFKEVNDSLGHEAGDDLLAAVAGRLQEPLRREDTCARLGGRVRRPHRRGRIRESGGGGAEDIGRLPGAFAGGSGKIAAPSIGGARSPKDGESAKDLMKAADRAMCAAKCRGGPRRD